MRYLKDSDFLSAVFITLSTFFVMSSITGFMPFAPIFFEDNFSSKYVGLLVSLPSISALFLRIPFGSIVAPNPKIFAFLGSIIFGVMFLFINTIRNIEYVILFRVVQGLGLVMYFVAVLTMVNSISKKIKNSFFIYNTMLYMPMIYSSPLAKFLYDTKESYAFYYIVVMSIIGALLIIPIKTIKLEKQGIKIGLKLFLDPVFGKFFISLILLILADAFIYMCLPLHSQGRFMGLYFMLWGASTTVFRFFYAIKTINAEFDISKYTLGLILISAMILLFDLRLAFLSLSAILHGWGWAILDPLIMHQVASRFYNYPEGPLMSSFSVSYDIGYLFGPILFSMIYYEAGFEFALLVGVFLTFIGVHIWQKIK